jgi:hypothetical protein
MRGAALCLIGMAAGLSACVAAVPVPIPLAASGPVAVALGGQSYIADLQPLVGGATLAVTREGVAFGYDQGLEAKRVAEAFCAGRGRRLAAGSLGRFMGDEWLFDGGCA